MALGSFQTVADLRQWHSSLAPNATVGLVPTMGALHAGHLSLVTQSLEQNDFTVISIFVNPSQFAPGEDLDSYPRTWDSDLTLLSAKLKELGIEEERLVVFAPTVSEMYPSGIDLHPELQKGAFVTVLGPSEPLEGKSRPLFFRGVCTIVIKLLNAVQPQRAYFGQKDIQQVIVVQRMVRDLLLPVEIVVGKIVREVSGLALSSRNAYLQDDVKEKCQLISRSLKKGAELFEQGVSAGELLEQLVAILETEKLFEVDYVSVNEPIDLKEREGTVVKGDVLSMAVFVNQNGGQRVRLIDNVIF